MTGLRQNMVLQTEIQEVIKFTVRDLVTEEDLYHPGLNHLLFKFQT